MIICTREACQSFRVQTIGELVFDLLHAYGEEVAYRSIQCNEYALFKCEYRLLTYTSMSS